MLSNDAGVLVQGHRVAWSDGTVHGCPSIHAATVHPDPTSRVQAFACEQKILMLTW